MLIICTGKRINLVIKDTMLISFSVENWASFREQTAFTMIASREKQHKERLPFMPKHSLRLLPIAAIYGGNASGKTNLFKALKFVKDLIVKGTQPESLIHVDQFILDKKFASIPTHFSFDLLIDDAIYSFGFSLNNKEILEEKLIKISGRSEKTLYYRKNGNMEFNEQLNDNDFLRFAFKGTRDNQLFLTNAISQNIKTFKNIYDWFNKNLILISPDSSFGPFEMFLDEGNTIHKKINDILPALDIGISQLGSEEIKFENLPVPDFVKKEIQDNLKEGMAAKIVNENDDRFVIMLKSDNLTAKKLVTYHKRADGSKIKFELNQEADGSKRMIDLLPAFIEISNHRSEKIFVIDELDRSLHTLLTRSLLEIFLDRCSSESRAQLIFTTHDVLLMDQKLLRRDEMWIAERDTSGASTLTSFSEYKDVRKDRDIRKSYLQGRMGGIPKLLIDKSLFSKMENN